MGSLKPNDLGLFDMLGNVFQWCQDAFEAYPVSNDGRVVEDTGDSSPVDGKIHRVLRGCSGVRERCAFRHTEAPNPSTTFNSFRVARTYDPRIASRNSSLASAADTPCPRRVRRRTRQTMAGKG